jgi:serine/threonine-protein kinase
MVYVPGGVLGGLRRSLVWVDRMGGEEALPAPSRAYQYARISPDATRVALDVRDQENDIWIWTFGRQTLTRLTIDPALDNQPAWTPDSRRVVFVSTRTGGVQNLYSQPADGTGGAELIAKSTNQQQSPVVSPDGTRLVFREVRSTTGQDLMVMPLPPRGPQPDSGAAGGRPGISLQQQPLVQTRFAEPNAEISPDGRWFAYESNQSGRFEIYVRPFPASESGLWQVSSGGGRQPLWARNGRELFFTGPDGALMGVRVGSGPTWSSTTRVRVLQRRYYDGFDVGGTTPPRTFDIAPDGRRFLMIKQDGGDDAPSARSLVVVQNWFQELERLVPTNGADPR